MNNNSLIEETDLQNYVEQLSNSKNNIRIIVTDSGLGGLSVAAEAEEKLSHSGLFEKVEIIFFNAYAGEGLGYNEIESDRKKIKIFDNALKSMEQNFHPDIILIACNTLSVIYDKTEFFKNTSIPVVGIVEFGVNLIEEKLKENEDGAVILLGTPTTINAGTHKKKLISKGINKERIISQPCKNLESEIQRNPKGEKTEELISEYIVQSMQKSRSPYKKFYACLCCTHYGYAVELFRKNLPENSEVLNPNQTMAETLFGVKEKGKGKQPEVSVKVFSKNKIPENEITALGELLERISPKTSSALQSYFLEKDLFHIE
jgi:glutamate racemase